MIYAFEASLKIITEGPISLEQRYQIHRDQSAKFKAAALALGFKHVAIDPNTAANGMTAVYVPDGIAPAALIGALGSRNIVIAGGLHKDIKTRYIRFGHLGHSAVSTDHVDQLIAGLQGAHAEVAGK